ncbi:MAG: prolyl oligopeptidase family serine peptidase [Polyangiaceae bacterium]|nr:prolyl oligopeptidase family serine peptidase [Polyangiaceae bacterium]
MSDWRDALSSAIGLLDHGMLVTMRVRGARDRARTHRISADERLRTLAQVDEAYGCSLDPSSFFPEPEAMDPTLREVRPGVWDARWPSPYTPFLDEVAALYMANVENRTAHARLFLAPRATARPAIIAVHGYMGGQWILEQAQWPIARLMRRGLDVALPLLPSHAARAGSRRGVPNFPSSDPRLANEGFRQAVADIVSLARWLRERGAPHVGIMGMSLGGYVAALIATVSDSIDFVMPMVPLASIANFAREQGRLGTGPNADEQQDALERANWVVSPLARPLRIPSSRALVVAAEHDHVTPLSHAMRIARHFNCELVTIPGGHLLQRGRASVFRHLTRMLESEGVIRAHP